MKKILVIGIIILLLGVSIPSTGRVIEQSSAISYDGNTLYVGGSEEGNYSKIQDAIDNASNGDTVFVYNGTYFENIFVNKSISLIGEDKDTTIINGSDSSSVVVVKVNKVNITGFTIRNGYNGILIRSHYNTISNTTAISNGYGIELTEACYNTIKGNEIISNRFNGIYGDFISNYNVISGNIISDNKYNGITLLESSYNTIKGNNISNNRYAGIYRCWPSGDNTISDNSFFNNGFKIEASYGNIVTNNTVNGKPLIFLEDESNLVLPEAGQIILIDCDNITIKHQNLTKATVGLTLIKTDNCLVSNNIINSNSLEGIFFGGYSNNITENTLSSNRYGIQFFGSSNTINENTISNNSCGIYATYNSYNNTIYHNNFINNIMNAADYRNNTWDRGYPSGGNFWDDYNGTDADGDGIGDTPYPIPGGDNEDRYPLMEPYNNDTKDFFGTAGPICPFLNIVEIEIIDGNESQIEKIDKWLNNRLIHFFIPRFIFINVTDLDFKVSYQKKIPKKIPLFWNFAYLTFLEEHGNQTLIDEPHIVTVKGLNGQFGIVRGKPIILFPPYFIFEGDFEEAIIEYLN